MRPGPPMITSQSTPEEVFEAVRRTIAELFEFQVEELTAQSHLFEELDLDSLDAADMRQQLHDLTGQTIAEARFQEARTVGDVVTMVQELFPP